MELANIHIDHKILAKHFGKVNESMRISKKQWEENKKGLWEVYVKAYNFDKGILNQSVFGQSVCESIENQSIGFQSIASQSVSSQSVFAENFVKKIAKKLKNYKE